MTDEQIKKLAEDSCDCWQAEGNCACSCSAREAIPRLLEERKRLLEALDSASDTIHYEFCTNISDPGRPCSQEHEAVTAALAYATGAA